MRQTTDGVWANHAKRVMTSHLVPAQPVPMVRKLRGHSAAQRPPRSDPQSDGRYFTDGNTLYRFVEWLTWTGNFKLATVEDCRTLGLLLVSGDYLAKAGLRPVH